MTSIVTSLVGNQSSRPPPLVPFTATPYAMLGRLLFPIMAVPLSATTAAEHSIHRDMILQTTMGSDASTAAAAAHNVIATSKSSADVRPAKDATWDAKDSPGPDLGPALCAVRLMAALRLVRPADTCGACV